MKSLAKQQQITAYFLGLTAAATLLSQSAMDLFSTLLSLWMLFLYFKLRRTPQAFALFPKTNLEMIWPLWVLIVGLGFWINAASGAPWLTRIVEFKWILLVYILTASFAFLQPSLKNMLRVFAWIMALTSLLALLKYFIWQEPRLEGLLNPMTYAHMYGMCLCLLAAFVLVYVNDLGMRERFSPLMVRLVSASTLVTGFSVLLTFTRGVWMGCFLGIFIMASLLRWVWGLAVFILGAAATGLMFAVSPYFRERLLQAFSYQDNYDMQRVILWQTNWEIFKQYPILGVGYGENGRRLREFYDQLGVPAGQFESHAHNQYLHFLAGTGSLGAGIYVFVSAYFLILSFKLFRSAKDILVKTWALGSLGALICFHSSAFTESNFEHAKVRMVVMFIWALTLWLKARESSNFRSAMPL